MSEWLRQNGIPIEPILGEDFGVVTRSYLDSQEDRPQILIPNLIQYEISFLKFKEKYNFIPKPFGIIDFETWRDFTSPNMCSFLFYQVVQNNKKYCRVGMKPVEVDGEIIRESNGWPKFWEDDLTKWKNGTKSKNHGRRYTTSKKTEKTIHVMVGWLWENQVVEYLPKLIEQSKCEHIYAHNATVDVIALMSLLYPDISHPLEHFVSINPDDRTRILMKGGNILTATLDLAPFLGYEYSRQGWNYKEKKLETFTDLPIEFRDSYSLLPMSLGALGNIIGYEKTYTPEIFTNQNHPDFKNYMKITNEMVRYAIDDCIILWRSLVDFWVLVKELGYHGKAYPLTIGTLGFQMVADDIKKREANENSKKKKKELEV